MIMPLKIINDYQYRSWPIINQVIALLAHCLIPGLPQTPYRTKPTTDAHDAHVATMHHDDGVSQNFVLAALPQTCAHVVNVCVLAYTHRYTCCCTGCIRPTPEPGER